MKTGMTAKALVMRRLCLLVAGLSLLSLSACGSKRAQQDKTVQDVKTVTVTLVGADFETANMRYYLSQANAAEEEYQYKVISSFSPYNSQDLTAMNTELLSGNSADLILFTGGIDTATDHFENLDPYLDQSNLLSREGFLPNLLDSLAVNGELHELWTGVSVYTAMCDCEQLAGSFGLPPQTLMELVEDREEYCCLFEPWLTADELWKWGASIAACAFVDYEHFTCYFDDPSFLELLSLCTAVPKSFDLGDAYSRENQALLHLFAFSGVKAACDSLRAYGNRMYLIGLPCVGSFYSLSGFSMAIPKTSENKEGAWRFFERQLSKETQLEQYGEGEPPVPGVPVTSAAFETKMRKADPQGEATLRELLDRTCHAETVHTETVRSILLQEGYAYLNGAVSEESFVDRIQAKISLFLSEHKW